MTPAARTAVLLLCALLPAPPARPAPTSSAEGYPLTLLEAIESSLEKNERIVISRESLDSASEAVRGARGAYDPFLEIEAGWRESTPPLNSAFSGAPPGELSPTSESVDAGAALHQLLSTGGELSVRTGVVRATTDGSFTFLSPAYDTFVGVELRQPLLRDRAIDPFRLNVRLAASERELSDALLRVDVTDTVAAVERAYWIYVALREAVAVREDAIRLAEEQLEETRARIDSGIAPDTEVAQPLAELERRRGDLLATQEAVVRAQNALKLLILDDSDDALWTGEIVPVEAVVVDPVEVDIERAIELALAARPEIEAAAAVIDQREIESRFASNQVQPALDAVVSYDRFGLAGSLNPAASTIPGLPTTVPPDLEGSLGRSYGVLGDGDLDDVRAGLVFSIPLGNRSAKSAAAIARNGERQAAAELTRTRKIVRAEVLDAAAAVETTYQRVEAARAALDAARVQLEAEQDRFAAGLSTNFLVLTRQNDLEERRIDEIAARTDYLNARTAMGRATGTLLDDLGIDMVDIVEAQ
ncbi:MAG TPA: TolC family protein [Candidatus Polarisedimenticolaceae bacterium]|nr:TolC family protein [Candidatus Polarisedimenticolaceae bacterium]